MKVLMINKFLYPNGGSETYIFKLGDALKAHGHEVQYFGMEHEGRCVGNAVNAYTSDMDFHGGSKLSKLTYPIKTIYSSEARKKIRLVLDDFKPDVCHLNNFNYQLTPSIILEIRKWEKESKHKVKIVFTAHDYQLVCPNHMMNNPATHENCEKCGHGAFTNCTKGKCIHGSTAKSAIGTMEATFWKIKGTYKQIDTIICPTQFMKSKMDYNPVFKEKTVAMLNFIDAVEWKDTAKKNYVLYFGRFSEEKGIKTLISACRELPEIHFIFAGTGPLEDEMKGVKNIKNVSFQTGEALETLIREARFSIYPSEWYENCPFSVMESQMYGTPVLGADIGGIPELITVGKTGELFKSGDKADLKKQIQKLWSDKVLTDVYSQNCKDINFDTLEQYYQKIMRIYGS
ncbi:MAG: glycosyltransferase [Ruminococcus sp.]|nr:glycosyltransferase [Ruminococcus sp.]